MNMKRTSINERIKGKKERKNEKAKIVFPRVVTID